MKSILEDISTLEEIEEYAKKVIPVDDLFVRYEEIGDIYPLFEFLPNLDRFAGVTNGRLLGYYKAPLFGASGGHHVLLYNHSFTLVDDISLDYDTKDAWIYITSRDYLIVLHDRAGSLFVSSYFHGRKCNSVQLPTNQGEQIFDAYFWETGLVFITSHNNVYFVDQFTNCKLLFTIDTQERLTKIVAIPPERTQSGEPTVYVTCYEPLLWVGTGSKYHKVQVPGTISFMQLHSSYEYIAFLIDGTKLVITMSNLSSNICTYDIENEKTALSFDWLGDMIIIGYEGEVSLCSCNEYIEQWELPDNTNPLIFSSATHALLFTKSKAISMSIVSQEFVNATRKLQPQPGRILIEALISKSSRIVDSLNQQGNLTTAIKECTEAAKEVYNNPKLQRTFILAAIYGNSFIGESDDQESISTAVKVLRLMNALKDNLNIYMNAHEIEELLPTPAISLKYCQNFQFDVAHEIADYTQSDHTPIVTDWCCYIIKNISDDNDAYEIISKRKNDSLDPTAVAIAADRLGRSNLANMISRLETYPLKLVNFFMSSENWETAMLSALRSMDTKLFLQTLNKVLETKEEAVRSFLIKSPLACFTLAKYAEFKTENDPLLTILKSLPPTEAILEITLRNLSRELSISTSQEQVKIIEEKLEKFSKDDPKNVLLSNQYSLTKKLNSSFSAIEETAEILGKESVRLPINKAIEKVVLKSGVSAAIQLAKKAGIKEKRYQVIIARAVIMNNRLDLLPEIAKQCPSARQVAAATILCNSILQNSIGTFIASIPEEKERISLKSMVDENELSLEYMNTDQISSRILLETPLFGQ